MKTARIAVSLTCSLLAASALGAETASNRARPRTAHMQARIKIPPALLSSAVQRDPKGEKPDEVYLFGGDIRIGDLDGDGTVDFVLAKAVGQTKLCHIAAFTWDGRVLWQWGDKACRIATRDKKDEFQTPMPPVRPGPLLVVDIDGDGQTEVVAMTIRDGATTTSDWDTRDAEFLILDGKTGRVEHRNAPAALTHANALDKAGKRHPPNYVHQRLFAADFRGTGGPHDFAVKIGNTILACDNQLRQIWTYENKFATYGQHSSYIPTVGDVDADGKDELLGGCYLLDDDGTVLWEKMMASHNDSVAIVEWDGNPDNGKECVMSGSGQVVNATGQILVSLGQQDVPHGQEVRCGQFRQDLPGLQMAVRYNGHENRILLADREGKILTRFEIDPTPINVGMETVHWFGPGTPAMLFSPPSLWDGHGQRAVNLPMLPAPSGRARVAWFHCIPADLEDTGCESVILFDPCTDEVFVYGANPLKQSPPVGYKHTNRQYNVRLMD